MKNPNINNPKTYSGDDPNNLKKINLNDPLPKVARARSLDARFSTKKWLPDHEGMLTGDEIKKLMTTENILKLSTSEYLNILKQSNAGMLTHVVRQGVRDHNSSFWHQNGLNEFQDNFKNILKSGKSLKSALALKLDKDSVENGIKGLLSLDKRNDRIDAIDSISSVLDFGGLIGNGYADLSSVHFAKDVVMDSMYGGEMGNEIFFAYPEVFISSQMTTNKESLSYEGSFDQHNDVWVKPTQQECGINVNASFVFIPKDQRVNKENGSKYLQDGTLAIESDNSISSEEYWNNYFSENPTEKPKHIIFYDHKMSPTEALNNWKSINGLADTKNKYFFSENLRTKEEMNTSDVKNELIRVAELIVNKEFPINEDFFMQLLKKEKEETYYEKHFNAEKYFSNKKDMGVYRLWKRKRELMDYFANKDNWSEIEKVILDNASKELISKYIDSIITEENV